MARRESTEGWLPLTDSVVFFTTDSLSPQSILRGTVRLHGYRDVGSHNSRSASGTGHRPHPVRRLRSPVRSAARVDAEHDDPRAATKILQQALYDFAITWTSYRVTARAGDSTTDNDKARAFLTRRWGEAAIVDSVAVDAAHIRVRLHGRYVPIVGVLDERKTGSACAAMPTSH